MWSDSLYCVCVCQAEWMLEPSPLAPGWPTVGRIEMQNFGLRYRDDLELAIHDISVTVEGGEKVSHGGASNQQPSHALCSPRNLNFVCVCVRGVGGDCGPDRSWEIVSHTRDLPNHRGGSGADPHRRGKHREPGSPPTEITYHHHPTGTHTHLSFIPQVHTHTHLSVIPPIHTVGNLDC